MPTRGVSIVNVSLMLLSLSVAAAAAPPLYCTAQRVRDDFGVLYYPNGQRVVDAFGKEYYPNGNRIVNDFGDEIRYSNGSRTRNSFGNVFFPNGTVVKSAFGDVRYPNGARTRDPAGTCYFETGAEMRPCQLSVEIRERLPGGETAFYRLDLVAGTIDLRTIRYEFPSSSLPASGGRPFSYVISVSADLVAGRIDRGSIAAVCTSGPPPR